MSLKKSMIAVSLIGLTWAGTAQAGFLGNNLDLQLLQGLTQVTTNVTVSTDPTNVPLMPPLLPGVNINVAISDTSLDLTGSVNAPTDLSIVDINDTLDPILSVSGPGASYGTDNGHQFVKISGLDSFVDGISVGVSFGSTVPEPGAFYLVALGLTMLLITAHLRRRRHARA